MARRYVRDKAGRFAPKGGGSKGKGGKMGKSAKNVKARAAYKSQSGKLREAKKMAGGKMTKSGGAREQKFWNRQLGGAKSGMTRVSNRLAGKGKGAAATKAVGTGPKQARGVKKKRGAKQYDNTTNQMFKSRKLKRDLKRKYPESKAAKRVAAKAKKATAAKKKVAAKKKTYGGLTPKQQYKAATSKARAAKSGYAQDRGQGYDRAGKAAGKGKVKRSMKLPGSDSARGVGSAKAQVTKLKKKFGKGGTKGKGYGASKKGQEARAKRIQLIRERGGALKGKGTAAQKRAGIGYRQTQAAFGLKTKGRVPKGRLPGGETLQQQMKSAPKKVANYGERGKGSKAKRRAKDLRDVKNLRNAAKASNTPKGAKKNYLKRANEIEGKYSKKRR